MGKSFYGVALALVVTISGSAALAQEMAAISSAPRTEAVLNEYYGRGVHAFFSHDDLKASDLLNRAIAGGSKDPRAYYFRGLVFARQGRSPEAQADFKKAAELEVLGLDRGFRIGRALERIQGPVRTEIELARSEARLNAHNAIELRKQKRYEEFGRDQADSARPVKPVSPGSVVPPPPVRPAAPPPVAAPPSNDPFGDDDAAPPKKPAPPADEPAEEPAADEPAEDMPAEEAPSDEEATEEPAAEETPEEDEKPADKNDDPFGN
jgi:hypothetical protein